MYQLNLEIGAIFDLEESSLMGEVGVDTRLQQVEEWRKMIETVVAIKKLIWFMKTFKVYMSLNI